MFIFLFRLYFQITAHTLTISLSDLGIIRINLHKVYLNKKIKKFLNIYNFKIFLDSRKT